MAADIKKNDDFSKGPISKTVLRLAVPMVLAQFVNVLYNIVDRMYIGHISDTSVDALTGVGVTFPILLMVTAFANLFGTGGTPLFSMARGAAQQGGEEGEKQRERAADVMNNTFSMLVITGVILCMVVLLIKKPVLYLFGASDATYPYADSYLSVLHARQRIHDGLAWHERVHQCARLCEPRHADGRYRRSGEHCA